MIKPNKIWMGSILLLSWLLLNNCQNQGPTKEGLLVSGPVRFDANKAPFPKLSAYAFFKGIQSELKPNAGVLPYELITPLFTDYAHKSRFVWMPKGEKASVNDEGRLEFPDQAVLIKNFYYPADFKQPEKNWDLIETRLLMKIKGEWQAFTYVWDELEHDADLNIVGDFKPVSWQDEKGRKQRIEYVVPNKTQCKSCHNRNESIQPIGPKVANLNKALRYPDGKTENQLSRWQKAGYLATGDYGKQFAKLASWNDPKSGSLDARARAYLDVNCGHCHHPQGPAHSSGLYLQADQADPTHWGVCKPPVAAGKGSGGRQYGIVPGHPESSILLYRMEKTDPGVMMPEIGRVMVHQEAVELIRDWIADLKGDCK
ncbi:SO2930 family diheme c-type cytochrome [Haliscomenobacter sp.]|uniref:SO2930 family diheme c-type cytochrome n=1 Tax=Haliscomenobacter sp. TaxID=2717303 RepID=UPI0033650CC5